MRSIKKNGNGGHKLVQANLTPPATPKEATSRWSNFTGKDDLRRSLFLEQYHLCCYSEIRPDLEGLGFHIEHVENKRQNPLRTFDYQNLAASALDAGNDLPAFKKQAFEVFGGHAVGKQKAVDMNRFISCHSIDCTRYFAYLSDGRIVPAADLNDTEREKAQYTIDVLNLQSPYLVTKRRQWWDELDTLFEEHIDNDWDVSDLVSIDLLPTGEKLQSFFTLTRQFYGNIAERVIEQNMPELD